MALNDRLLKKIRHLLNEGYYHQALHWFYSSAFSIDSVCYRWGCWLRRQSYINHLQGELVIVSGGIEVGKEDCKMPRGKGLHQESDNVSKPAWIWGHYFSALLLGKGHALFVRPIIMKLHDEIPLAEGEASATVVEKMASLCATAHDERELWGPGCVLCFCQSVNLLSKEGHTSD